jgi:hypothetical protein
MKQFQVNIYSLFARLFESALRNQSLKEPSIDLPSAATELMKEERRNGAQFQITGPKIGARLDLDDLEPAPPRSKSACPQRKPRAGAANWWVSLTIDPADRDLGRWE